MKLRAPNAKAFTLFELLITVLLISMVFAGSTSVYLSSLRFLRTAQLNDVSVNPTVSLETIGKAILLSNNGSLSQGNTQLDLRADYNPASGDFSAPRGTPGNTGDDGYWHYRFINNSLVWSSDANPAPVLTAANTVLVPNVVTASSSFTIVNPSGQGTATVVRVILATTIPAGTLDTNVALGAKSKN